MRKIIHLILAIIIPAMLSAQWEYIYSPPISYLLNNAKFFSEDTGVLLADNGFVEITHDGGLSWFTIEPPFQTAEMQDFFMFDTETYIAQSYFSNLMVTFTGGTFWDYASVDFTVPDATDFLNLELGFSGTFGIENSNFGKAIFKMEGIGPYAPAEQVYFTDVPGFFDHILCLNEQVVLATFELSDNNPIFPNYTGILLRSEDQGNTWDQMLQLPQDKQFQKLDVSLDGNCIYAQAGDGMVYYSTDEGLSWEEQEMPDYLLTLDLLTLESAYGVIVTSGFGSFVDTFNLAYTNDAWQTWSSQYKVPFPVYIMERYNKVQMVSETTGYWACNNELFKTTNGGFVSVPEIPVTGLPDLKIMPNPASSHIKIEIPNGIHQGNVVVYNNLGAKVFGHNVGNTDDFLNINTSTWPAGLYQVSILSKRGKVASGKVVINNPDK